MLTKVLTAHVPIPLVEKVDAIACSYGAFTRLDCEAGIVSVG